MQSCKHCNKEMVPKISLEGDMATILKRLSADAHSMRWSCPACHAEREAPLKAADIEQVKSYVRRQKKAWWQFWIR